MNGLSIQFTFQKYTLEDSGNRGVGGAGTGCVAPVERPCGGRFTRETYVAWAEVGGRKGGKDC